ncbi:DUF3618 domain-containing protein [Beijerinckia sp. L45]|uniref:DUF3618 domain-containing protein n=1 Tax=Beijerinckia sp. L45 TaxID=1641855 RepID=UPI00131AE706|nr:DUF3618 domain-containing protein [Beijerinckia sp. L45]
MSDLVETAASAEAEVEQARADLAATLDQLKDNLQPKHLFTEVMARPRDRVSHWLATYGRFAKHSPIAGVIIGAAALTLTGSMMRRDSRRARKLPR